ncbi:MAG: SIR2 family protein [Candidatus Tenebribacter burtonii]|jgi:hypothetical protein|nr:SIR2 family protein [Candidatus Tenebribacter burtonii]
MNELVPLIASLATRNRNYVLFAGAGLSKDAGVKSGWDILIETLIPLYIAEKEIDELPANHSKDIEEWYLQHESFSKLGYSEILELMHRGEIERRDYLEKFFKDETPGEAHKQIAQMVSNGLIRFIFTTNFDNLIEKALDEINIDYDVIFSDDILEKTKSWDKVKTCRIYKLHGDYKTGKIRNTVKELETLDRKISDDFQYIIDRHGIVVIGYAGRDKAIMDHFMIRKPYAYPFYWQYRTFPLVSDEYKLFYKLKDKYEKDNETPIIYLENSSVSDLLSIINSGIQNLEISLISTKSDSKRYRDFIVNNDQKKIRALSLELIKDFQDSYIDCDEKRKKNSNYLYQFDIMKSFFENQSKTLSYLKELLEFEQYVEIDYFCEKIHNIILDFYPERYGFYYSSILYYFLMTFGALLLEYNYIQKYIEKIFSYYYKNRDYDFKSIKIIPGLSLIESGWKEIEQELYKKNYFNPKVSIIEKHLLPTVVTSKSFMIFDAYITIKWLLSDDQSRSWASGAAMFNDYIIKAFVTYFEKDCTEEKMKYLIERINEKYKDYRSRTVIGLNELSCYLGEKYKI